jgi:acyl carrier protein
VDRAALPDPGRGRPPLDVAYAAPRTGLEKILADIWAEALQLDQVGVDDHFVDLGGHSLAAARLNLELNTRLEIELPLSTVLGAPTVAAQARAIVDLLAQGRPDDALARALDHIETS